MKNMGVRHMGQMRRVGEQTRGACEGGRHLPLQLVAALCNERLVDANLRKMHLVRYRQDGVWNMGKMHA